MKRLLLVTAITSLLLTMASISWASISLNSSRSNVYRVASDGMTSAQTAALVAELDKTPRADEATVRKALQKLFIPTNFKLIQIIPGTPNKVILLMDPANANAAQIAVSDPGVPAGKTPPNVIPLRGISK